jgi:Tfp pilus assembly protein PilX
MIYSSTRSYFTTAEGMHQQEATIQQQETSSSRNWYMYNSRGNSTTGSYYITAGGTHPQEVTATAGGI